jgi:hypothetical protein
VVATLPFNGASQQTLRIAMPVGAAPSLYPRIGDLFAWLAVVALAMLAIYSVLPKRHAPIITPQPVTAE